MRSNFYPDGATQRIYGYDVDAIESAKSLSPFAIAAWPLPRKASWANYVNEPLTDAELAAVRQSVNRGRPFGEEKWSDRAVRRLGLESTLRPQGRPKKAGIGS